MIAHQGIPGHLPREVIHLPLPLLCSLCLKGPRIGYLCLLNLVAGYKLSGHVVGFAYELPSGLGTMPFLAVGTPAGPDAWYYAP